MAKVKYGYAESSDLAATYGDGHIYDIVDNDNILENGMLVKLGDTVENDEIHAISSPAITDEIVLVLSVPMIYDQSTTEGQAEYYFYTEPGKAARAYNIIKRDRFAIADYMVTTLAGAGKPAVVGNFVVVDPSTRKYVEVAAKGSTGEATDMSGYGFYARINKIEYKTNLTLYRLEVMHNEPVVAKA